MTFELHQLADSIVMGDRTLAVRLTREAVGQEIDPRVIVTDGLMAGMTAVGEKFGAGEFYLPEVLIAARAMSECLEVLEPLLLESPVERIGTVVIGTVEGDLHEIGKNLVAMMLRGSGFQVIDLGVDVAADVLVEAVHEHGAKAVAVSALLTTTASRLKEVVDAFVAAGVREQVTILVGGAPVTQELADEIGADGYAPDAARAVEVTKAFLCAKD